MIECVVAKPFELAAFPLDFVFNSAIFHVNHVLDTVIGIELVVHLGFVFTNGENYLEIIGWSLLEISDLNDVSINVNQNISDVYYSL